MEAAISPLLADECNRVLGEELSEGGDEMHVDPVRVRGSGKEKAKELDSLKSFKVSKPPKAGDVRMTAVNTTWVLTWKMAEGGKTAQARPAAKCFQAPDLEEGVAETSGCKGFRSSHLQVIFLSALKN